MFPAAVTAVSTIFVLLLLGVLMAHLGWVGERERTLLSRLVVNVAVPATVIQNMLGNFTWESLVAALPGLAVPVLAMLFCYPVAAVVAKVFKLPQNRRGVFGVMIAFSNGIFIGLPITQAILGDVAVPFALLYYVSNTILFWTIGVRGIMRDGGIAPPLFSRQTVRSLASPALITFALVIVLMALRVQLPVFLMKSADYVAGMVTPVSSIFIGVVLYDVFRKGIHFDRSIALACVGRFILSPAVCLGLCLLLGPVLGLPGMMKQTFLLLFLMPVMSQCPIIADRYGGDAGFAAVGASLTTAMTLVIVPIAMVLSEPLEWLL